MIFAKAGLFEETLRREGSTSKASLLPDGWLSNQGALRVQVPNSHILTPNLYYCYYCQELKYQLIGQPPAQWMGLKQGGDLGIGITLNPMKESYWSKLVNIGYM